MSMNLSLEPKVTLDIYYLDNELIQVWHTSTQQLCSQVYNIKQTIELTR